MSGDLSDVPTVSVDEAEPRSCTPAIMQYDRNAMLKLYHSPFSKIRPGYLSEEFDRVVTETENGDPSAKLWSPDMWIESIWKKENGYGSASSRQNRSGSTTSSVQRSSNGSGGGENSTASRRRQGVDRLKAESKDGIVLSPQRRSFGAGCQAPAAVTSAASSTNSSSQNCSVSSQRRSVSPSRNCNSEQETSSSKSVVVGGVGGVGSGKLRPPATGRGGGNYNCRGDRVQNWRDRNYYDNRNNNYQTRSSDRRANGVNYYGSYRQNEMDLPEWATDGPSDMHETIELHGFDDDTADESISERRKSESPLEIPPQKQVSDADVTKLIVSDVETLYNGSAAEAPSGSRFSKFFAKGRSDNNNNNKAKNELKTAEAQNSLMEFLSKAKINVVTQEKDSQPAKIPAGAMNLEDLEAMLCQNKLDAKKQPPEHPAVPESSGKQFLQDLFKSAASNQPQTSSASAPVLIASDGLPVPDALASATRPTKVQTAKGNPLSDPNQQQHLLEALQKLQVQQQSHESTAPRVPQPHMPFVLPQSGVNSHPALLQAVLGSQPGGFPKETVLANILHHQQQSAAAASAAAALQNSSPQPPHHMMNAGHSPLSQQELLMNAQMVYQKALLNRKLEEQKESFVKRQLESGNLTDSGPSGSVAASNSVPAGVGGKYSAFLPTSVLKQMHGVSGKPQNFATAAKEASDLHKTAQTALFDNVSAGRPIVKQPQPAGQPPQPVSAANLINPPPVSAANSSPPHPQDVIRFMHQQQQMQLLRLQQFQMLQQLSGGLIPRMANANKPVSNEEYQQMVAVALLQQQQQQQIRAAAAAAATSPAVPPTDLLRQRAMLAAAQQQQMSSQQQQQLMNSFRPSTFAATNASQQPAAAAENNLRNIFNVGNYASSTVVFPPMPVGAAKPMTLDELERLQKQNNAN